MPSFRRFSFRGITRGRALNIFHKQDSDEVELSHTSSSHRLVLLLLLLLLFTEHLPQTGL